MAQDTLKRDICCTRVHLTLLNVFHGGQTLWNAIAIVKGMYPAPHIHEHFTIHK